ncbi:unnamed protein product [Notodromas monacha]|uniref:Ferritin n=1 Tax=Notodromas monacha TaxID=399045 RepID=A0A7R9BMP3_9CRUS|nr:unnamed protein product [Notodromas monacha]CAG0918330.1 unnamed protein product [Notodromas monacha]
MATFRGVAICAVLLLLTSCLVGICNAEDEWANIASCVEDDRNCDAKDVSYNFACFDKIRDHGAFFNQGTVNRPGIADFFFKSASEERQHAMHFIKYLMMRGNHNVSLIVGDLRPAKVAWKDALESFRDALDLEKSVTQKIQIVTMACNKVDDFTATDLLTTEFLNEQIQGLRDISGKIATLKSMTTKQPNLGEYLFDLSLQDCGIEQKMATFRGVAICAVLLLLTSCLVGICNAEDEWANIASCVEDDRNCDAKDVSYNFACFDKIRDHGAFFNQGTVNRPGIADFFFKSASEERQHAMHFIKYLMMRGNHNVSLIVGDLRPAKVAWKDALESFRDALDLEKSVTQKIQIVTMACNKVDDFTATDLLTTEFLNEQIQGLRDISGKIATLKSMTTKQPNLGEYLFDLSLQE